MTYDVILADPPWEYDNSLGKNPKYGGITYPTMKTEEICKLKIDSSENSILFLWGVWVKIDDALKVIKAWGYTYKTCGFLWEKINDDGTPRTGIGNYTNSNSEFCLIGVKGKFKRKKTNINQIIRAKVRKHSQKPDEIYTRIEEFTGKETKKLEMFSRHKREGWDVWGNQIPTYTQNILK